MASFNDDRPAKLTIILEPDGTTHLAPRQPAYPEMMVAVVAVVATIIVIALTVGCFAAYYAAYMGANS